MTTSDPVEVEQVARIINPSAWAVMDGYLEQTKRKYQGQHVGWPADQFQHKESMATARQILASLQVPSPAPAAGVVGETGWLIEHGDEPKWLTLRPAEALWEPCWTKESLEAVRFARRSDAEDYVSAHFDGEGPLRIIEHAWPLTATHRPQAAGEELHD